MTNYIGPNLPENVAPELGPKFSVNDNFLCTSTTALKYIIKEIKITFYTYNVSTQHRLLHRVIYGTV